MNLSSPTSETSTPVHRQKGLIVFCERNLRYEGGLKAWFFLGPYFIDAFVLEILIDANPAHAKAALGSWIGFLAYLILFPSAWRRVLKLLVPAALGKAGIPQSDPLAKQPQA